MPAAPGGFAPVLRRFYVDNSSMSQSWLLIDCQSVATYRLNSGYNFAGKRKTVMRHYLTVVDVLKLYPTRKKTWAYKQLQAVRDATGKPQALVRDFAEHVGLSESELRDLLSQAA